MTDKQINPNLRKLAELTYNPKLKLDETLFEKEAENHSINAPDLKGFIYVPSVNLYFAKERSLLGKSWNETQTEIVNQALGAMPTPYQFREFLKYLRDSKEKEHHKIYKEITEVREPWRAEWLNAKFEKRKNGLYMISENVFENGAYGNQEQKLENYLSQDKTPGISLDEWLNLNEKHGLPPAKTKKGELWYWSPENGYVAGFDAGSGRAYLYCDGRPDYADASLGVFACAEKVQGVK